MIKMIVRMVICCDCDAVGDDDGIDSICVQPMRIY